MTHEVAHRLLLHTHERRAETTECTREIEAEAVAFVICEATGLNPLEQLFPVTYAGGILHP